MPASNPSDGLGKGPILAIIAVAVAVLGLFSKFVIFRKDTEDHRKAVAEREYAEKKLERDFGKPPPPAVPPKAQPPVPPAPKGKELVEPPTEPPAPRKLKRVPAEVTQPSAALSGGYQARLTESLLEGDELVCTALVTQVGTGAQRTIKFTFSATGGAQLTLPDGTRVKCSSAEIAGHVFTGSSATFQFDKDVPVKFVLRFRAIPPNTTKLALLDLGFPGKIDLTFRDAPVQRLVAE